MSNFDRYIQARRRTTPDFDAFELWPQFRPYFHSGQRVKVEGPMGVRFGRVSVTTGWRPAFLLMHRQNATGSWDVLARDDVVSAVKVGRTYRPVRDPDHLDTLPPL